MYGCVFCNEPIPDGQRVCRECMIKRTTIHAKDKKSAILDYLRKHHTGKRNAVHSAELERLFSLDDRAVRLRSVLSARKDIQSAAAIWVTTTLRIRKISIPLWAD